MKTRSALLLSILLGLAGVPQAGAADNLLLNGSFENPPGITPYQVFNAGNSLPGWTVESGTVEITAGTYWQAAEGAQSLDLNGIFDAIGTIYQDVATTPGQSYKVRFAYAGNPECGLPTLKTANAYWNGQLLTNLSFDITGHSNTNVGWIYYEQTVTATGNNSRVRFQATSPTFCGLTLDDVSVTLQNGPDNQCVAPPSGAVGWWRAEGNSSDAAGDLTGATPFGVGYAPGVVGQAFDFNGTSRRVSLPDSAALKLTDSLTIEGWIFIRSYGGFILFRGDNRPGLDPYALVTGPDGHIQFHIESQAAAVNLYAPVPDNQWKHVAATLDGSTGDMRIYVNGLLAAFANTSVRPFAELDPSFDPAVGIGNHGGTFHQFPFNGLVDELALYNRALSPSEIQSIYTAGSTGKCIPAPPPSTPAPVIASFSPVSATVGSTITISGTNFSSVAASNIVFFGAVRATVVSASTTSLSVTVPSGTTYAPITVTVGGLLAYAARPFQPTFLGDGSSLSAASFAPRFDLAGGDGAHRSVIADLDGDGKPDIAVADVYGHTISLFRNISSSGSLSSGSFAPRVVLPAEGGASDNPYGFVAADVDGDGKPDLVACDRFGNHVSIYRNLASPGSLTTGSFAPWVNFNVGADPRYARVADLDGDGRPDIVSANYGANTISILRNIGTPGSLDTSSFAPAVDLPAGSGPYDVAIGDLDGDGKPDLAVVCTDGPVLSLYRNLASPGALTPGSFAARVDLEGLAGNLTIALGDIDGDAKSDLVFGSYQSKTMSVYRNQASPGPFTTSSFAPRVDFSNGNWTHTVALGDLNGDGKTDIATVGELASYLSVYQNLSTPGSFTTGSLAGRVDFGAGWNAWGVSVGDLDGDGRPDVVFCNAYDDSVSFYQNVTPFTNTPPQTNICVTPPTGLVSWWRWEGDGLDSAAANHGTVLNGAGFAAGKVGQALSLDGLNDHFRVGDQPNLRLTNELTVEAWIYPTSLGAIQCIMSKWDAVVGPDQRSFTVGLQPDGRAFLGLSPNGIEVGATVVSSNSVPVNQWTYLAVTYDGTALRIYLNGVVHDQTPYTQGIFPGTSDLGMGANVGGTPAGDVSSPFAAWFAGMIDEPGIYNRALSPVEIASLYAAGNAGKCVVSNPPPLNPILAGPITNSANGHWYYLLDATNWPAAEQIAVSLGGYLATINDAAENDWVFTNFSNFGGVERALWIGLTDQEVEGDFRWISGDTSSYRNWSPIEPNNGGGFFDDEDHALIWQPSSGYPPGSWNDAQSNQLLYAVVEVGPGAPALPATLAGPLTNAANGHWYYLLDATNWPAAEQMAASLGGHLASINNAAENDWVFTNFSNFGGVERLLWIGANDAALEGIWFWISGEPATYSNWALGEPNNFGEEDHALIWHPSSGHPLGSWNDATSNQLYNAVVEVSAPESLILSGPITNWMNGHRYYLLNYTNWPAAEQIAASLGGHLATINNAEENLWVYDTFSMFGGLERPMWIGLTDATEESNWQWISGEAASYLNWAAGEPNSGAGVFPDEDHAMIWHPGSGAEFGTWNDGPSNHLVYAVVEVAPPFNQTPMPQVVIAPQVHLPGISNHLVISPVCAPATVILDASRSADAESDPLLFSWRQGANAFATGILATNHFNPGIYQLELRVSDATASPANSFTLQVISPRQAVALISNLVQSAQLDPALAEQLLPPLRGALQAFDRCTAIGGSNQLAVFQGRVQTNAATLGAERSGELLAAAQEIIDALKAMRPSANPSMANPKAVCLASGEFRLRFNGEPGRIYFIEATCDWVTWEVIGVAAAGELGTYEFLDVNAGHFPGRFYRAVSP